MPLTSISWICLVAAGLIACLFYEPYIGLLTYLFIYFLSPSPEINWWGNWIPTLRWSLLSAAVLLAGCFINPSRLNSVSIKKISPGKWLVGFLVISILISLFVAVNRGRSLDRCYDFLRYVIVYYLTVKSVRDEKQLKFLFLFILLCGLFLGYQAYNTPRHSGRLEGVGTPDTANANHFALLLVTITPLSLPVLIGYGKKIIVPVVISLLFILNGIVLCNSRGAIIAMGACLTSLLFMLEKGKLRRNMIFFSLVGLAMFVYLADPVFWERFSTITESSRQDGGSGRLEIWKNGIKMVPDHPLGAGGDGFILLSPGYIPLHLLDQTGVRAAHNTYLLVLVEQGIAGFLVYICFLGNIIVLMHGGRKKLAAYIKTDRAPPEQSFLYVSSIAVEAALWGHVAGAFFGNRLYYEFYYILCAIGTSIAYMTANKAGHEEKEENR